jgi:hypothetical protein
MINFSYLKINNPKGGNPLWELSISINFGALASASFWILEFGLRIETGSSLKLNGCNGFLNPKSEI